MIYVNTFKEKNYIYIAQYATEFTVGTMQSAV